MTSIVLVEGNSDKVAVETLAHRYGRDLALEDVEVVAMGGATNIASFLNVYGPRGRNLKLAGLCDAREEDDFVRAVAAAGLGADLSGEEMEALGFFVCVPDLEGELIRSLGAVSVENVIESEGELSSFRTFQRQPAQRERSVEDQQRRFLGTQSGRKSRYARTLVNALDLAHTPRPLSLLLSHVALS